MLKNILKLEGVAVLKRDQQKSISGGEFTHAPIEDSGGAACSAYCGGGVYVYCHYNCRTVPGQGCYNGNVFNSCP